MRWETKKVTKQLSILQKLKWAKKKRRKKTAKESFTTECDIALNSAWDTKYFHFISQVAGAENMKAFLPVSARTPGTDRRGVFLEIQDYELVIGYWLLNGAWKELAGQLGSMGYGAHGVHGFKLAATFNALWVQPCAGSFIYNRPEGKKAGVNVLSYFQPLSNYLSVCSTSTLVSNRLCVSKTFF